MGGCGVHDQLPAKLISVGESSATLAVRRLGNLPARLYLKRGSYLGSGIDASKALLVSFDLRPCERARNSTLVNTAPAGQLLHQLPDDVLGVAEEHPGPIGEVQLVIDTGEARVLASLDGEHRPSLVGVNDRHPEDRAGAISARCGVHDVVGP